MTYYDAMRILGVDPGTARVGWAILNDLTGKPLPEAFGLITTEATDKPEIRLLAIHTELTDLIRQYQPQVVGVEEIFFSNNAKTIIPVAQARGVVLLTAAEQNLPVVSYSPLVVKRTICGDGRADKIQVQKMIARILHLATAPKPDDVADAVAIALTHAYSYKLKQKLV